MSRKSIHFARCIGVFEGGGIRGAAHAGAFLGSVVSGINFEATIGSSAGSMIAVLIAAGLTPEQVIEELHVDLSSLLVPSELSSGGTIVRLSRILGPTTQSLLRAHYGLGLYKSAPLRAWMNKVLRKYLPNSKDPVVFQDLHKPVAVMATDLLGRRPKVWSRERDPATPVAYAVEASCAIPFFFQPVGGEATMLVDGGILSNLPLFLVPYLQLPTRLPILCFRLKSDVQPEPEPPKDGLSMIRVLMEAIVNGATEVQLSMGQSRQIIQISTGQVGTTDFHTSAEQADRLVKAGQAAVQNFVNQEQLLVTGNNAFETPISSGYRQDLLERTAELIRESVGPICVFAGDMSWLKELHIALLLAVRAGRQVRILYDAADAPDVREAVAGAAAAGALLVEARAPLPLKGTLVNPRTDSSKMIAVEKLKEPFGRVLSAPADRGLLAIAADTFDVAWQSGRARNSGSKPIIEAIPIAELTAALEKGIPQYKDLSISVQKVSISKLLPLSCFLEPFKLARVAELEKLLSEEGLENAARIQGSPWPITPPVVERLRDGTVVIIDGTHRVYHALQNGQQQIRVVLVENGERLLPAEPLDSWTRVRVVSQPVGREQRYRSYNQSEFRPIQTAFSALSRQDPTGLLPRQPVVAHAPERPGPQHKFVLSLPRVPFRGHQMADFFKHELSPGCSGFRLELTPSSDPYWRAGFALSPEEYIREGSSDIEITKFFLFHVGRGDAADPAGNTSLHYRAYYNTAPLTQSVPFGNVSAGSVALSVELDIGGGCRVASSNGSGISYSTVIVRDYIRYLFVLAWADGILPFRIPMTLDVQ